MLVVLLAGILAAAPLRMPAMGAQGGLSPAEAAASEAGEKRPQISQS